MGKRRKPEDTEKWLWDEFAKIKESGKPIGPAAFAAHVGISRTYLYRFTSLVAAVGDYRDSKQSSVSRRRGLTAGAAKKHEIDAQVRREHTQWGVEIEELRGRLKTAQDTIATLEEDKRVVSEKFERLRRLYEYVLMLAVEAGVSASELERIQEELSIPEASNSSILNKA